MAKRPQSAPARQQTAEFKGKLYSNGTIQGKVFSYYFLGAATPLGDLVSAGKLPPGTQLTFHIERCINCADHAKTTNHDPERYTSLASAMARELQKLSPTFPTTIVERQKQPELGAFEVVMNWSHKKVKYEVIIYSKNETKLFPKAEELARYLLRTLQQVAVFRIIVRDGRTGEPLIGARVVVTPSDGNVGARPLLDTFTSPMGAVDATCLPFGQYRIVATANDSDHEAGECLASIDSAHPTNICVAVPPVVGSNEMLVILNWASKPAQMDLCVWTPNGLLQPETPCVGNDVLMTIPFGFGPNVATLRLEEPGRYRVFVRPHGDWWLANATVTLVSPQGKHQVDLGVTDPQSSTNQMYWDCFTFLASQDDPEVSQGDGLTSSEPTQPPQPPQPPRLQMVELEPLRTFMAVDCAPPTRYLRSLAACPAPLPQREELEDASQQTYLASPPRTSFPRMEDEYESAASGADNDPGHDVLGDVDAGWADGSASDPGVRMATVVEEGAAGAGADAHAAAEVSKASFSAFAPPKIQPATTFSLKVWAYEMAQRQQMLQRALEGGKMDEAGQSEEVSLRLGSTVRISLDLPPDAFACDGPAQDILWDPPGWEDRSGTHVEFSVSCLKTATAGLKQCKAWVLQDGLTCAVLDFTLIVSHGTDSPESARLSKAMRQRVTLLVLEGSASKAGFDGFINYRVRSEAGTAEKVCKRLLASGADVFWDKRNLPDGCPWELAFRRGLKFSRHVISLISADGLSLIRDNAAKRQQDNVLLEYELALDKCRKWPGYVIPVAVGGWRRQGSAVQLWSAQHEEWQDVSPASFPDVHSVTCSRQTVRETMAEMLDMCPRVDFTLEDPMAAIHEIVTLLSSRAPLLRQPSATPKGDSYDGVVICGPATSAVGDNLVWSLRADRPDHHFAFHSVMGDSDPDATAAVRAERCGKHVLLLSSPELQQLQTRLDASECDPLLELCEVTADRLAMDPTSVVLVLVGDYVSFECCQHPPESLLQHFGAYGAFAGPRWADTFSPSCAGRSVAETFRMLFQVQGIHLDPRNPEWATSRVLKLLVPQ